jgi:hypothetical protein
VSRKSAAKILNISVSELKRRDALCIYPFLVDARGVHWYNPKDLGEEVSAPEAQAEPLPERPLKRLSTPPRRLELTGPIAIECFNLFAQGRDFLEVVQKTKLPPDIVQKAITIYRTQTECLVLDKDFLTRMQKFPWVGAVEMGNPEELFQLLERNLVGPTICEHCKRRISKLCVPCSQGMDVKKLPSKPCELCRERIGRICKPCALGEAPLPSHKYRSPRKGRLTKVQREKVELLARRLQRHEAEVAAALKIREEIEAVMAEEILKEAEAKIRGEVGIDANGRPIAPSVDSDSASKAAAP